MTGKLRTGLGLAALVLFGAQFAILDLLLGGAARGRALPWILSTVFWCGLAWSARARAARVALALSSACLVVVQGIFFRHYHSFLDAEALACARRMWTDVAPSVVRMLPVAFACTIAIAFVEWLLIRAFSWPLRRGHFALALGGGAGLGLVIVPAPPPDGAALGSFAALARPSQALTAGHIDLPLLPSRRSRLPNILVILTESVRAQDYCEAPLEPCPTAPRTAALLPERVVLRQLRSTGSYTAVSVNALLAGRMPLGTRQEVSATPLLFDYARAVRAGSTRLRVAYWSAQTDSLFERSDVADGTDSFLTLDDLVGQHVDSLEDVLDRRTDALLAGEVERRLPKLETPLLVMLHLSGTHAPYFVDPLDAPFSPWAHTASWSGLEELHNAYKNAIVAQDHSVARMLRAFLGRVGSEPWLVLFTSDHGEAFGEHKAIHHGQNVYDEQIHVPGFVASGNGALDLQEERTLASHGLDFSTHLDVLPTLLDALGVLDAFGLEPHRAHLVGRSWLRPFPARLAPLPVTNCTQLFPCPLRNGGMLGDGYALVAQAWDSDFRCVDLRTGAEGIDRATPGCAELRRASHAWWATLPSGRENREPAP